MTLAAQQVVDAIASRLAGTATLVTTKRMHPLEDANLPAWKVLPNGDDIDTSIDGGLEDHGLEVVCTGTVRATDDIDDALGALVAAGLTAIHGTQAPQFTVATAGVSPPRLVGDGEASMAAVDVRLRCKYFTVPTAPETLL